MWSDKNRIYKNPCYVKNNVQKLSSKVKLQKGIIGTPHVGWSVLFNNY